MGFLTNGTLGNLRSPVYKQQISRFIYQQVEQKTGLSKASHELDINIQLAADSVIAQKELFDKRLENAKLQAAYAAFKTEQIAVWQQELAKNNLELSQLLAQQKQQQEQTRLYEVKAPVSGIIQNIGTRYIGGTLTAGETLCIISPEVNLLAECYVSTKDAGLLKAGQEVRFQVDAFDYNYFGILTGKVIAIDNDFTVVEGKPVFKVRCLFDTEQMHLKNGYSGRLKKGLTFQSRFVVARRTLWQLLWDKADDWLNPSAPVSVSNG
jgi:HlyD family secretion protein